MRPIYKLFSLVAIVFCFGMVQSCDEFGIEDDTISRRDIGSRIPGSETRHGLILYSAGFNSLSPYLLEDIEDLATGYLPTASRNDDMIFIVSRLPGIEGRYGIPTSAVIIRLYRGSNGDAVMDTLKTLSPTALLSDAKVMNETLSFIKDEYPAKSYGMIFSSHATGWLPQGYYNTSSLMSLNGVSPYIEPQMDPNLPAVKSIGQDVYYSGNAQLSKEMELPDFAEAIPMHLDYLLFDACLMGGIEVAYELKDVADMIGFSQAEVLADGLVYNNIGARLLEGRKYDVKGVCEDYFDQYNKQTGTFRSATISLVDTRKLEPLAEVCKDIFSRYRGDIYNVSSTDVQRYFRFNKHWFFDLEDILNHANIPSQDMKNFKTALDNSIIYKAATPYFIDDFQIKVFSGYSMYLPSYGSHYLNSHYRSLQWNKATGLVQ